MKLQFSIPSDKLTEVPEQLREYYVQQGTDYVLSVEGVVPTSRLNEFRTNNTRLIQETEELLGLVTGKAASSFRGMTKEDYLKEVTQALETLKKPVKGDDAIEQEVTRRFAAAKTSFEAQIATLTQERDSANNQIATLQINNAAIASARALGLMEGAEDDLLARITKVFTMKNGKVVALDGDGHPRFGVGGKELTIEEFVKDELVAKAPHLFKKSEGMRSDGGGAKGSGGKTDQNPWLKGKENLTQQALLNKQNPTLAARLKAEAGYTE